jgi:hypothetical protein
MNFKKNPSSKRRAGRPDPRGDTVITVDFDGVHKPPRDNLTLQSWLNLKLPPRDHMLGELLSTTSRWLLIGDTGIGKTLLALALGAASAAGDGLLGWPAIGKPRRVMYLDGEMPSETAKERLEIIAAQYGRELTLWFYGREVMSDPSGWPPLNTEEGEEWLFSEIEAVNPDLIIFDSVMSLLLGEMGDEKAWAPITPMMRKLSQRRIAQIWLHHTGINKTRGFGTKTREWQMDTVAILERPDDAEDEDAIQLTFTKARLRTPRNRHQFSTKLIKFEADGWKVIDDAPPPARGRPRSADALVVTRALIDAYNRLAADGVEPTRESDGSLVRKVEVDALRDEVKNRGYLETKDTGGLTSDARQTWHRAKSALLTRGTFIESGGLIWRVSSSS